MKETSRYWRSLVFLQILSHDALNFHIENNARIASPAAGRAIMDSQFVIESACRIFFDLLNSTAKLGVNIGIIGIDDRDCYTRITFDVLELLAYTGMCKLDMLAIP